MENKRGTIRVDTQIKIRFRVSQVDLFIPDERKSKMHLIKIGMTSQDKLQMIQVNKMT